MSSSGRNTVSSVCGHDKKKTVENLSVWSIDKLTPELQTLEVLVKSFNKPCVCALTTNLACDVVGHTPGHVFPLTVELIEISALKTRWT